MITAMQIKTGWVIKMWNDLLLPLKRELHRGGRWATNIKVRFKNLINGNIVDKVFDSEEKLEDIVLERSKFEFLYESGWVYYFMDQETYEQIEISEEDMWDAVNFITPSLIVDIQRFEGRLVWVILPASVKLLITECEPGVKWNTADGTGRVGHELYRHPFHKWTAVWYRPAFILRRLFIIHHFVKIFEKVISITVCWSYLLQFWQKSILCQQSLNKH